ncbi:MAG: hypothetical protein P1V20_30130 [Verrucomicrobiales bacterium]|nr:hypothetical protein [Verrucomicrobiales bacterium]
MKNRYLYIPVLLSFCGSAMDGFAATGEASEKVFEGPSSYQFFAQTNGPSLFLFMSLFFLFLIFFGLALRYRSCRMRKFETETRLSECVYQMEEQMEGLEEIGNRTLNIKAGSESFTGTTRKLSESLFQTVAEMEALQSEAKRILREVDELIDPESKTDQLINSFTSSRISSAAKLMEPDEAFQSLIRQFPVKEREARKLLTRLETGINGLAGIFQRSARELEMISEKLPGLINESQRDGFFPLIVLQTRLLPSINTMLDESARIGATDPVSAYEDPALFADRQITDAALIIGKVDYLRQHFLPQIESVKPLLTDGTNSPEWIKREWLLHSKSLETISSHAELWSVNDRINAFSDATAHSVQRIYEAANLADHAREVVRPSIRELEKRVALQRLDLGEILDLRPETIMREGEFNPDRQVVNARQSVDRALHSLSRGHIDSAKNDLDDVDEIIHQTDALLNVGKNVATEGIKTGKTILARLAEAKEDLPIVQAKISGLGETCPPDVLPDTPPALDPVSLEIDSLIHAARISAREGRLLTAGWQIDNAAGKLDDLENHIEASMVRCDEIEKLQLSNEKLLGDLRWRCRSLDAKVQDRRTRKRTNWQFDKVNQRIEDIGKTLSNNPNPFKIKTNLAEIQTSLHEIEENVNIDRIWHELATESIKSAGRTLRSHESAPTDLKDDLGKWQSFLEEDNLDWKEAFEGGLMIETASYPNASSDAISALQTAAASLSRLLDWQNPQAIELDRRAGFELLQKARNSMMKEDHETALGLAHQSRDRAENELNLAISRTNRVKMTHFIDSRLNTDHSPAPGKGVAMTTLLTRNASIDQFGAYGKSNGSNGKSRAPRPTEILINRTGKRTGALAG